MRAVPGKRRSSCERHNSMRRGRTEDPKTSAHISGIRGMGRAPSRRRRRIPSTSSCGRKLYYLRYERAKNTDPRSLSTSTTMITGPDRNRRLSLWSRRAAGGLRRPSESRALLAFPRLSLAVSCVGPNNQRSLRERNSMMQCRTEDLKTSAQTAGIRGIVPTASRRRRWIPSISSALEKHFGHEEIILRTYLPG